MDRDDDLELDVIEPPENLDPVSREEAKGMWRQLDMHRYGMWRVMQRLARVESDLAHLVGSMRVVLLLLGVPCLLSVAVLLRVLWLLSGHEARALLALVAR